MDRQTESSRVPERKKLTPAVGPSGASKTPEERRAQKIGRNAATDSGGAGEALPRPERGIPAPPRGAAPPCGAAAGYSADGYAEEPDIPEEVAREVFPHKRRGYAPARTPGARARSGGGNRRSEGAVAGAGIVVPAKHRVGATGAATSPNLPSNTERRETPSSSNDGQPGSLGREADSADSLYVIPTAEVVVRNEEGGIISTADAVIGETEAIRRDRIRLGLCPGCGTQLFEMRTEGILGRREVLTPITDPGVVHRGRCLSCDPSQTYADFSQNATADDEESLTCSSRLRRHRGKFVLLAVALIIVIASISIVVARSQSPETAKPMPSPTPPPFSTGKEQPSFDRAGSSPVPTSPSPRIAAITDLVQSISGDKALDTSSPQGEALRWMLREDPLQRNADDVRLSQRYALVAIYFSLGGRGWQSSPGWLTVLDECLWKGVICNDATLGSRVVELNLLNLGLPENEVIGTIPPEISELWVLETLGLNNFPNLSGPIPATIGNLVFLRTLWLYGNNLSGSIPSAIGNLTDLVVFNAHSNNLTGQIPFIGSLKKLETLWLNDNALSGTIGPEIGHATRLKTIRLSHNSMKGTIPSSISSLSQLTELNLENNTLTGKIPETIASLSQLVELDLEGNALTGTIPVDCFCKLSQLVNLDLENNALSGTIPETISRASQLQVVILANNSFTGTVPPTIGSLSKLAKLFLQSNSFTGTVPPSFGGLSQLQRLSLSNNAMNGTLPLNMGANLTLLDSLFLQKNEFLGSVPVSVCALRNNSLQNLWADCGGDNPELECTCCTSCY